MFYTYIVTNRKNGAIYTGHTDDIAFRVHQHREGRYVGFSRDHGCRKLAWFEIHDTRDAAFRRERQIKEWRRSWKLELIETDNPHWDDLYLNLTEADMYDLKRIYEAEPAGDGPRFSTG